ncbi:MAG: site-specific DNA-methyltransferase, partial [Methanobacteriaceae archaeon]|nr:site-specific DNA-methyltransferase [Methanobacteriaceae archaeon]
NMMYPRLKLARNLLKEDGVIFISIDDHEVENLKKICNEIFGEENYITQLAWFKGYGKNESHFFSNNMEYILIYSKNFNILNMNHENYFFVKKEGFDEIYKVLNELKNNGCSILESEKTIKKFYKKNKFKGLNAYNKLDENFELYRPVSMEKPKNPCYFYNIIHPITKKPCKIPKKGWRMPEKTMLQYLNNNLIIFGENEKTIPNRKYYLKDMQYETPKNFILNSKQGGNEILDIFDGCPIFDYPKPISLINYLIRMAVSEKDLVLDFFSGSATTAHSVMQLNSEDEGDRKFVMVQIPEVTSEKSQAFKDGYENICEIGKERIRRAGDKIVEESGNKNLDIGFKVFKLDSSNLKKWDSDYKIDIIQTLDDDKINIKKNRTSEDLVYEIMLKYGIDLTLPIEKYEMDGNVIYSVGYGALLICLDNEITIDIIDLILKLKEDFEVIRVVFKDNGFASDSDKTNIKETLKVNKIEEFITF